MAFRLRKRTHSRGTPFYERQLNQALFERSLDDYADRAAELIQQIRQFPTPTYMSKEAAIVVLGALAGEDVVDAYMQDLYDEVRTSYFLHLAEEWDTLDRDVLREMMEETVTGFAASAPTEERPDLADPEQRLIATLLAPCVRDEAASELIAFWEHHPATQRLTNLGRSRIPMTEFFGQQVLKLDTAGVDLFRRAMAEAWTVGAWLAATDFANLIPDKRDGTTERNARVKDPARIGRNDLRTPRDPRDIYNSAMVEATRLADPSVRSHEKAFAVAVAVAWTPNPEVALPFILIGLRDWHRLDPVVHDLDRDRPTPDSARNLAASRTKHLDAFEPQIRHELLQRKFYAESFVLFTPQLIGDTPYAQALEMRRESMNDARQSGLRHPGPWTSVEHLWDLGFAIGVLSSDVGG